METLGITVRYRPIRIGWCIRSDDYETLQESWQLSFTMWGGCYNPVIPVDDAVYARNLVNLFRVDVLWPLSNDETTTAFIKEFPHLSSSFLPEQLFVPNIYDDTKSATILDIYHPIHLLHEEHSKNNLKPKYKVALYDWDDDDPLSNIWSAMFGKMPSEQITGIDYTKTIKKYLKVDHLTIETKGTCQFDPFNRITLSELGCRYMQEDYSVMIGKYHRGFYMGSADTFSDLVNFWNLRAAGAQIMFIDECYAGRFDDIKLKWLDFLQKNYQPWLRNENDIDIWSKNGEQRRDLNNFGKGKRICTYTIGHEYWNNSDITFQYMYFSEEWYLATIGTSSGRKRISFRLTPQKYTYDRGIFDQYLVLSLVNRYALLSDERVTLVTPYIPELNNFYGRNYFFYEPDKTRVEPESIGVISRSSKLDLSIYPIEVNLLIEKIFQISGIVAKPSTSGLIATRLIQQMGGLQECWPFKILGVRNLIKRNKPEKSFTHKVAFQTIKAKDSKNVFNFLLKKSVFSAGLEFNCPNCHLKFWTALNDLSTKVACSFCWHQFNITPYLKDRGDWRFRRSGLFGRNDNQEGAIPVILVLQQLYEEFYPYDILFTTAMNLKPDSSQISECEIDFVVVTPNYFDEKIQIAIGECKTRNAITKGEVAKLKAVADAFSSDRFEVYVILAKLKDFTPEEVQYAIKLNDELHNRVILFTARELEPNYLYERRSQEFDVERNPNSFKDMADNTYQIYFQNISTDS